MLKYVGAGGSGVEGVGLQPLDCWIRGLEIHCGHGCSSVVFVVCCVGSGLCDGLITGSEECYSVCVCVSNSM